MSFDLSIETRDVDGNPYWVEVVCGHTYNLTPMWAKALPGLMPGGTSKELDGLQCGRILPEVNAGLISAVTEADDYRALNPSNGWGDYDGFLMILTRFVLACHTHPSGTVRWSG